MVDDLLPLDSFGHVLLPSTTDLDETIIRKLDDVQVELWPFLLFKAICKVAILSAEKGTEIVNFSGLTLYTGWIIQRISTDKLTPEECWSIFEKYSPEYKDDDVKEDEKKTKNKKHLLQTKPKQPLKMLLSGIGGFDREEANIPGITPIFSLYFYVCEHRFRSNILPGK